MLSEPHSNATISVELAPSAPTGEFFLLTTPLGGNAKRIFDVAVAVVALILLSPLMGFIALFLKLSSSGPAFFSHPRVGHLGRSFGCLKYRTMVVNGNEVLERHFASNPAARMEWESTRKLRRDPRVTPFGAVLRKMSLDELPQLINVARGEMSLVGPRPIVREELALYGADAMYYLAARPGITGRWQVSGRSELSYSTRITLDKDYVKKWSWENDFVILAQTVPAVVRATGVY